MKVILSTICLCMCFISSYAQLKSGIYFSFEEIKNNEPKIELVENEYEFITYQNNLELTIYEPQLSQYIKDELKNTLRTAKSVWCIILKNEIYTNRGEVIIHSDLTMNNSRWKTGVMSFHKLIEYGRVCLTANYKFFEIRYKGAMFFITTQNIKYFLRKDPELFQRFKKEKDRKDVLFTYIKLYNKRNPL